MYKHILVSIDGSDAGQRGLEEAIALARELGAALRIMHVVHEELPSAIEIPGPLAQQLIDQLRSNGECIIRDAASAARDAGVDVETHLIESRGPAAGESIVAEAISWPANLIVCGTHGRRGLRRVLLGSDAEHVVRHSSVPVLLVRGGKPSNPAAS